MKKLLTQIKSIEGLILSFFLIRLYGIWFPPLETWHSWRQSLTNMIARNMSEGHFSLFYPTIDMAGAESGIIGSEFPIYQALIAGFNTLFGFEHWYGRLISLFVASIASWCFYRLILRWWNERTALYATIIFLCSLWFAFSRKTMPDTFAVSLFIIGIFWIQKFLDEKKTRLLLFGLLFITAGGLCKIPAIFLFALLVPLWLKSNGSYRIKMQITIGAIASVLIILSWYFLWVPHLLSAGGFQLFFPKSLTEGIVEIKPYVSDFLKQFYFGALRSYVVLLPLLLGIIWLFRNRIIAISFVSLTVVFILFAIKTGTVFPTHNYYILPFVPVLAVLAALGLQRLDARFSLFLLVVIGIEAIANQWTDFRIKPEVEYRLTIEQQVDQTLPEHSKIILLTGSNPEWMYWYHRKGWSIEPKELESIERLKAITNSGGHFLVIDKRDEIQKNAVISFLKIGETKDCIIYDIRETTKKIDGFSESLITE